MSEEIIETEQENEELDLDHIADVAIETLQGILEHFNVG